MTPDALGWAGFAVIMAGLIIMAANRRPTTLMLGVVVMVAGFLMILGAASTAAERCAQQGGTITRSGCLAPGTILP